MRSSTIIAPLALAAGASAQYSATAYTTKVVQTLTTFCPSATSLVVGSSTYVVTVVSLCRAIELLTFLDIRTNGLHPQPTTLTITNCPCTVTQPVAPTTTAPVVKASSGVATPVSAKPTYSKAKGTAPVGTAPGTAPISGRPNYSTAGSPIYANSTAPTTKPTTLAPVGTSASAGSVVASTSTTVPFKGAANKMAASGLSLTAMLGVAAYLL